jgi:hypothetical protein
MLTALFTVNAKADQSLSFAGQSARVPNAAANGALDAFLGEQMMVKADLTDGADAMALLNPG